MQSLGNNKLIGGRSLTGFNHPTSCYYIRTHLRKNKRKISECAICLWITTYPIMQSGEIDNKELKTCQEGRHLRLLMTTRTLLLQEITAKRLHLEYEVINHRSSDRPAYNSPMGAARRIGSTGRPDSSIARCLMRSTIGEGCTTQTSGAGRARPCVRSGRAVCADAGSVVARQGSVGGRGWWLARGYPPVPSSSPTIRNCCEPEVSKRRAFGSTTIEIK